MKSFNLFLCNCLIATALQAQIPADSLVAWYPFNGNANDESGNGNDGTITGAIITSDRFGTGDKAYMINGTEAYIQWPGSLVSINSNAITLAVWIETEDSDIGRKAIVNKPASKSNAQTGQWSFIVGIWTNNTVMIFVNGEPHDQPDASANLIINAFWNGNDLNTTYLYRGKIDDIRIYNRALTPDEILVLYNEIPCYPMPDIARAGSNQMIMDDTTTILRGNTPVEGTGLWTIVAGKGGTIDHPSNPTSIFHGLVKHSYTLRWTVSNELCSNFDEVMIGFKPDAPVEGLVAYYPFNGNANDESGNVNNGDVYGAVLTADRFGNSEKAYGFDGYDDYISINDHITLRPASVTISCFVKFNPPNYAYYYNHIVTKTFSEADMESYCIVSNSSEILGHICDDYSNRFDVKYLFDYPYAPETWGWYHLVFTFDDMSDMEKLFIDGILINQVYEPASIAYDDKPLCIGGKFQWSTPDLFFNGQIDDVRIYNHALNEFEVQAIYYEGGWGFKARINAILSEQIICKNDSTVFEVTASGIPPIDYQWQKDGIDIPEATRSILLIHHAQPEHAGEYRCIATNKYGTDTSSIAMLYVEFAVPTFILGPAKVFEYQVVTYSVEMQPGYSYEFVVEGGNGIDRTDNSVTVQWGAAGQGFIKLMESSENGCYAETNAIIVTIGKQ